ncbi:hypothetical protein [Chitinophaga sp. OAE865]|uniref:hypothetical protein n=1 Tax=Chitinophaga sp. OAE865 TaxID=2817898 RepID=UPI001AE15A2C
MSSKFICDLELALSPDLYAKLIKNALYYAPTYLALYGFIVNIKKYPAVFTAMDWETVTTKEKFYQYLKLEYSGHENDIMEQWSSCLSPIGLWQILIYFRKTGRSAGRLLLVCRH